MDLKHVAGMQGDRIVKMAYGVVGLQQKIRAIEYHKGFAFDFDCRVRLKCDGTR